MYLPKTLLGAIREILSGLHLLCDSRCTYLCRVLDNPDCLAIPVFGYSLRQQGSGTGAAAEELTRTTTFEAVAMSLDFAARLAVITTGASGRDVGAGSGS